MDENNPTIRFVIIGAGKMGLYHGLALKACKNAELVGVVSRSTESAKKLAQDLSVSVYGNNLEEICIRTKPNACIVAVSHFVTAKVLSECIELGLHVLVEKPVSIDSEIIRVLDIKAKSKGVNVMVAVNRRFYKVIQSGYLDILFFGGLKSIVVSGNDHPNYYKLRKSFTNDVYDYWPLMNTIHVFDLISFFSKGIKEVVFSNSSINGQEQILQSIILGNNGSSTTFSYAEGSGNLNGWSIMLNGKDLQTIISPLEKSELTFSFSGLSKEINNENSIFKEGLFEQLNFFINSVKHGIPVSFPACNLEEHANVISNMSNIFKLNHV